MTTAPSPPCAGTLAEVAAEALRAGVPGFLHVRGDSMRPTLADGTAVRIRPLGGAEVPVGRIAVFHRDGMLVIHRVVWKQRGGGRLQYLFKGDNGAALERVASEQVLGLADAVAGGDPRGTKPAWTTLGWDPPGLFYRLAHLLGAPLLRIVGSLTDRPADPPAGPIRDWLKRIHRSVESILFGRSQTR